MGRPERAGPPDEKLSVNFGPVDIGTVDLLVEEGFYASRADFIRHAVRTQLDEHKAAVQDATTRRDFSVGYVSLDAGYLRAAKKRKQRLDIKVVGVLHLQDDIDPALASEVIERVHVLGSFRAPEAVIGVLGDRVVRGRKGAA